LFTYRIIDAEKNAFWTNCFLINLTISQMARCC